MIITSREEVFKEFKQRHFSKLDLKKFELILKIKTPSYDYERRRKMILNCCRLMNCKWLESDMLVNFVLDYIQDPTKLSTPLKIRDFAISTKNLSTKHELLGQICSKSKETAISFSKEVKSFSEDKKVFLLLLFISIITHIHHYSKHVLPFEHYLYR